MKFITGERIVPNIESLNYTYLRHEVVYRYCLPFVKDLAVLDCGCGEGYGASLLISSAASVMAIDKSSSVIKRARDVYGKNNLSFAVADLEKELPLPDASYDVATSFQVIEHLYQPLNMLHSIRRVLKSNGYAIISTPNRNAFSPTGDIMDPYHVQEYDQMELIGLLKQVFSEVNIYALTGNELIMQLLNQDIENVKRIVRVDIFKLRKLLPNPVSRLLYAIALNTIRRTQKIQPSSISVNDFIITDSEVEDEKVLDWIAICGNTPFRPLV